MQLSSGRMDRYHVMQIKSLASAITLIALGALLHIAAQYASFEHVEKIKASDESDGDFILARSRMMKENPDFVRIFNGKIRSMTIDAKTSKCYFFYKESGKIFEDKDILYCYEKNGHKFLGRV